MEDRPRSSFLDAPPLTVPNFMFALAMVADTDLIAAVPRTFAQMYGPRFGVEQVELPFALQCFSLNMVVPRVSMMDAGLDWLYHTLSDVACRYQSHEGSNAKTVAWKPVISGANSRDQLKAGLL